MIGRHCDGWIELISVIRRDHCNVLQSKLRLLRRPSVEQGWSTGSAGVRDSSARSGVHDCTYPPHRSTCDQCRYFPSCTRGPPWISLFVAARCRFSSRSHTLQAKENDKQQLNSYSFIKLDSFLLKFSPSNQWKFNLKSHTEIYIFSRINLL